MSEIDPEILLDNEATDGLLEEGNPITTPAGEEGIIDRIEVDPTDSEKRIVFVRIVGDDGVDQVEEFPEDTLLAA